MRWPHLLPRGDRPRRGARRPARRHARRAARRRARTRARCSITGPRLRRAPRRAPRAARLQLRGPDRDRRRAARRLRGRRHAVGVAVGRRPALRRGRAEPEGRARRCCASSRAWSASPSTAQQLEYAAVDYERQVSRAVEMRPRRPGLRRAPRARGRRRGGAGPIRANLPSGDVLAREFQRFLRQRGTGPGNSTAARLGGGPRRPSPLGGRADDPVVADRARRVGRRRLEALAEDALGDLEHRLA